MKPKNLSEVKSQDEFLEYLIDNYYHVLGEGNGIEGTNILEPHYALTVSPSLIVISESLTGSDCWSADYMKLSNTLIASVQDYRDKIKSLRNKPSFEDHPDAKCFVQNASGSWYKNDKTSEVEPAFGVWSSKILRDGWAFLQTGKVIGDWKQSFEKAPELPASNSVSSISIEALVVTKSFMDKKDVEIKELKQTVGALESINKIQACLLEQKWNFLEELKRQNKHLNSENQELKNKLDRIKQSLT